MPLISMNFAEAFIFFIRLRKISVQEMFTKTDQVAVSFVKAGAVRVTLYFQS